MSSRAIHRLDGSSLISDLLSESVPCRGIHTLERLGIDKNSEKVKDHSHEGPIQSQLSALQFSEPLHECSTVSTANIPAKGETAVFASKLSLFFTDCRVARHGSTLNTI